MGRKVNRDVVDQRFRKFNESSIQFFYVFRESNDARGSVKIGG